MNVIIAKPPLYDLISAAFDVEGKPVLYCYGSSIYNPMGVDIEPSLFAHEAVHSERQGDNPEGWWRKYLAEPEFRLAEEIPAHKAEWQHVKGVIKDRNRQAFQLLVIANRLASPLYGGLISLGDAMREIRK